MKHSAVSYLQQLGRQSGPSRAIAGPGVTFSRDLTGETIFSFFQIENGAFWCIQGGPKNRTKLMTP